MSNSLCKSTNIPHYINVNYELPPLRRVSTIGKTATKPQAFKEH
jgi:hypothetical protein